MDHSNLRPLRWPEYLLIKTLTVIEGFALSVMPRGSLRKRLLREVDHRLQKIHTAQCGKA